MYKIIEQNTLTKNLLVYVHAVFRWQWAVLLLENILWRHTHTRTANNIKLKITFTLLSQELLTQTQQSFSPIQTPHTHTFVLNVNERIYRADYVWIRYINDVCIIFGSIINITPRRECAESRVASALATSFMSFNIRSFKTHAHTHKNTPTTPTLYG